MTQPNEQDREAARAIKIGICACSGQPEYTCIKHEAIATALANERARVESEADCEKASLLDCINQELRENHAGIQTVMTDDPRTAIRHLVDAVKRRGRDEAKAEDAEIARSFVLGGMYERNATARAIARTILSPASGPTVEQQVRAEIAEAVKAMPQRHFAYSEHGTYVRFSDVLAIIENRD